MNLSRKVVMAFAAAMFSAALVFAQCGHVDTGKATPANAGAEKAKQLKPQSTCPVMGGAIDKKLFVDYKGKRSYVCCDGCLGKLKENPEKYLKKLEATGQEAETIKNGPEQTGNDTTSRGK